MNDPEERISLETLIESGSAPEELPLQLAWQNRPGALRKAAEATDLHKKLGKRRNFYMVAILLIVWFFIPDLKNGSFNLGIGSWLMVAIAAVAFALVVFYPGYLNQRFAQKKAENCPLCTFALTSAGFELSEGDYKGFTDFAEEPSCVAFEGDGIIALNYGKNRVSAIPLGDLSPAERDRLRLLLRQGLGDRFEKFELKKERR